MLRVQRKQCATCIYRTDSPLDVKALEAAIADPRMAGHFVGSRICHHSTDAGQIAQRLGLVTLVDDDVLKETKRDGIRQLRRRGVSANRAKRR